MPVWVDIFFKNICNSLSIVMFFPRLRILFRKPRRFSKNFTAEFLCAKCTNIFYNFFLPIASFLGQFSSFSNHWHNFRSISGGKPGKISIEGGKKRKRLESETISRYLTFVAPKRRIMKTNKVKNTTKKVKNNSSQNSRKTTDCGTKNCK